MKKVAILGGGVAGMTAAHELAERGFEVEVHELKKTSGGKARTIYVEGTGTGGRPDLPGEHGFRFFPGFYRHLPDTMKRIPYNAQTNGVYDNLVQATEYLIAADPTKDLVFLARFPESIGEWGELLRTYFNAKKLDVPPAELEFFIGRLLVILTSCEERRLAEYEKITWWDFIEAETKSDAYKLYLAVGLTRSLVALKAKEASTRTVGDILLQLLLSIYAPGTEFDRVLNGPTSEVWLDPWLERLRRLGVRYHTGSRVTALHCVGGTITGATVRKDDGSTEEVTADYYVLALPVEQAAALMTPALESADPGLGLLEDLRVAWMNGIQFFLRDDVPLVHGHANFVNSPNAITSISQEQFWTRSLTSYGDGTVQGVLSADISDWEAVGVLYGKPLRELTTREEVKSEIQAQIKAALRPDLAACVEDVNLAAWFLDSDIELPTGSPSVNLEPLLINTAGSWQYRPEAITRIPNLFLAADYVRTFTDLATMEAANEAARRAVNGILFASGSRAPHCQLWPLHEPPIFLPAREYDRLRFSLGLPHADLVTAPPSSALPPTVDAGRLGARLRSSTVSVREIAEQIRPKAARE